MKIIKDPIPLAQVKEMAKALFGNFVKAVVDVEKEIIAAGGVLHSDGQALLLEHGSSPKNLWGINIYPDRADDNWIEFNSMINLRPFQGNRSRCVDDLAERKRIIEIVTKLVQR